MQHSKALRKELKVEIFRFADFPLCRLRYKQTNTHEHEHKGHQGYMYYTEHYLFALLTCSL